MLCWTLQPFRPALRRAPSQPHEETVGTLQKVDEPFAMLNAAMKRRSARRIASLCCNRDRLHNTLKLQVTARPSLFAANAPKLRMPVTSRLINVHHVCPRCRSQQLPSSGLDAHPAGVASVRKRHRLQSHAKTADQEEYATSEDPSEESRAESRRRRRENKEVVETTVDVDPVPYPNNCLSPVSSCFRLAARSYSCAHAGRHGNDDRQFDPATCWQP